MFPLWPSDAQIVAFVQLAQIRGLVSHVEGTEEFADDDNIFFVFDDEPGAALDEDALVGLAMM